MAFPNGLRDDIHGEGSSNAMVHKLHLTELLWYAVHRLGEGTVARDDEVAALERARYGDATMWKRISVMGS